MKKALVLFLSAILLVSLFISCGPEPKVQITIRYDGNGAEGYMEDQKAYKGEEVILHRVAFIYADQFFAGWNTEKNGNGDWYYDCDIVCFEKDITLYAQWFTEVETITFYANGGSGVMFPQWVTKGEATALRPNIYYKKGSYFAGWNTKADGSGDNYHDTEAVCLNDDIELYAQWTEFGPTIAFNANGGQGKMLHQHVKKGVATALYENKYTYENRVFAGWNTKKDGSGNYYADKALITIDKNITLYAQWAMDIAALGDKTQWKESDSKIFSLSKNVTIDNRVEIIGNVTLFLSEGKTLTASNGIGVNKGNSLTIDGSGNLDSKGTSMGFSGIGVDDLESECGDITINGGNIYAQGGAGGAGIGGTYACDGGKITINGGTIEAKGGSSDWFGYAGAGIGGGGKGSGGTVIINGGKVTATGRENSDGIGKGQDGESKGTLTLGTGVTIEVSDDGKNWSSYKSDKRHRYMRTK